MPKRNSDGNCAMRLPVVLLSLSLSAFGQPPTTGAANTKAPCSPANTGNNNTFNINCGIGQAQGEAILRIVNKILIEQIDPAAVMAKLEEIHVDVSRIQNDLAITRNREAEVERIRRTPPQFEVSLVRIDKDEVRFQLKSLNLVPLAFRYVIVTKNNVVVSGIPLGMANVYPTKERYLFIDTQTLELAKIVDEYLELRVRWKSLSYDELRLPDHQGEIAVKYRMVPDGTSLNRIP